MADFEPGRMVVFIRDWKEPTDNIDRGPDGPILYVEGEMLKREVAEHSDELGDHIFEKRTELRGLLIFEGWVEVGMGEDPDVTLVGEWRKLDHWEMCKVREGLAPWVTIGG